MTTITTLKRSTIEKRQEKEKKAVLEQLEKMPIIQIACERAGVGRASFYRWKNDDQDFAETAENSMSIGEQLINDMSESQLISLIKDKHAGAIRYWLEHHHSKYMHNSSQRISMQNGDSSFEIITNYNQPL